MFGEKGLIQVYTGDVIEDFVRRHGGGGEKCSAKKG